MHILMRINYNNKRYLRSLSRTVGAGLQPTGDVNHKPNIACCHYILPGPPAVSLHLTSNNFILLGVQRQMSTKASTTTL